MRISLSDINMQIEGKEFNGLRVLRVHDGTLKGTTQMTFRYKIPIEGGYLKNNEEQLVVFETHTAPVNPNDQSGPVMGRVMIGSKRYGVELIEIVPTNYDVDYFKKTGIKRNDDIKIWWLEGHKTNVIVDDTHPILGQVLKSHEEFVGGQGHEGTWQEFVDAVNAADPDVTPIVPEPQETTTANTCKAKTKSGEPCKKSVVAGSDFCNSHQGQ